MTEQELHGELKAAIGSELSRLVEIRRDLHAHPQPAFKETHASRVVTRELRRAGLPYTDAVGETGVVGWIAPENGTGEGIALRADLDALPVEEATGLAWASQNRGFMHACGHDGHTTMLLGAALVLGRLRRHLRRRVKLLFQPAEETGEGAEAMLDAGVLEERLGGFPVRAIFGLHGWPGLPLGRVATREGPLMASTDVFRITVAGRGGHGSRPEDTVDPIVAAAGVVSALQTVVSRNLSPLAAGVVTVGSLHAGDAPNVIPSAAALSGTVRALDEPTRATLRRRLEEVALSAARVHGATASVLWTGECPVTLNHPDAVRWIVDATRLGSRAESSEVLESPVMASEDFAYYTQRVPGCFAFLGLGSEGATARCAALHTPEFDFNDEAIAPGVETLCRIALHDSPDAPGLCGGPA